MSHQCIHCGKLHEDGSEVILKGCECGSHFFYFIKKEYADKLSAAAQDKIEEISSLDEASKEKMEKDVREMIGLEKEDIPVILDLESVKVIGPGKFEIDVVNLFSRKRPLIYKLEEGKYIVDLANTLKLSMDDKKKISELKVNEEIEEIGEIEEDE